MKRMLPRSDGGGRVATVGGGPTGGIGAFGSTVVGGAGSVGAIDVGTEATTWVVVVLRPVDTR